MPILSDFEITQGFEGVWGQPGTTTVVKHHSRVSETPCFTGETAQKMSTNCDFRTVPILSDFEILQGFEGVGPCQPGSQS